MATDKSSASSRGGISFFGLLAILFIGLKLTGYITWSWWWVLSPLWGGFVVSAIVFMAIVALTVLTVWLD